jgi:2-C-methyl-D-erythritol 4-phosphate cytidylyltransferase
MSAWAIIVAAGQGVRFGDDGVPKAFRLLARIPMYVYSVRAFEAVEAIDGIVLVVPENWQEYAMENTIGEGTRVPVEIWPGGDTRQASVRAGLAVVPSAAERVVVHDAARPLVTARMIETTLSALDDADGAVCAVPLSDTLKKSRDDDVVEATLSRDALWRAQTPQAFRAETLRAAHERALSDDIDATDDAALVERAGGRVALIRGDERNIKVTTQADLELAEALLSGTRVHP